MRAMVIPAALLLWAAAAEAQPVVVRGGEHDDFTRLVLRIPEGAAWALAPAPGGYEVRLDQDAVYDLGRAFDRIPRDRVQALLPLGNGRLALSVACDCHAEAELYRGIGLVIDVVDGPASSGGLAPGRAAPVAATYALPALLGPAPAWPSFGPLADGLAELPRALETPTPTDEERVARTEAAILESVAAAATQGLLDVAPAQDLPEPRPVPPLEEPAPPVEEPEPIGEAPQPEAPVPDLLPASPSPPRPGLAFRTGADTGTARQAPLGVTGTPCLPKAAFDLAAWAGGGEFDVEITAHLARLSDERDRLDPEAAEALARSYLAFGFGREAALALEVDGRSSRARDGLRLLARIVDGEPVPAGAFGDQAGCLGPVALWRALARGSLQGADERERAAAMIALRALPPAVRGQLALRLAQILLDEGDALAAAEVAALVKEGGTTALLTQAEITEATEGPGPALAELEGLARSDGRMTPDGLVELIDLTITEGRPVPDDTLELARALRFEHGGEAGRRLLLAEVRALTADSRFEEVLALLEEERAVQPGEDLDAALVATVRTLTDGLGDAAFLELALSRLPPDLPPDARETAARRLSDLGFPDEARALREGEAAQGAAATPGKPDDVLDLERATPASQEAVAGLEPTSSEIEPVAAADGSGTLRAASDRGTDWQDPPPLAELAPAGPVVAGEQGVLIEAAQDATSWPEAAPADLAATGPAVPDSADSPEATGFAGSQTPLAARRALLERAVDARARAAALLSQSPGG